MTLKLSDNGNCFACGVKNPIGLHLQFRQDGEDYCTEFTPTENHQGFTGITHGGILTTLLDEAMGSCLWAHDIPAVTAQLKISLRNPAHIGETLQVRARIRNEHGRLIYCFAEAARPDGTLVASAEGTFMRVSISPTE